MRNDWETPPTVEELIVRAWIGEDGGTAEFGKNRTLS